MKRAAEERHIAERVVRLRGWLFKHSRSKAAGYYRKTKHIGCPNGIRCSCRWEKRFQVESPRTLRQLAREAE